MAQREQERLERDRYNREQWEKISSRVWEFAKDHWNQYQKDQARKQQLMAEVDQRVPGTPEYFEAIEKLSSYSPSPQLEAAKKIGSWAIVLTTSIIATSVGTTVFAELIFSEDPVQSDLQENVAPQSLRESVYKREMEARVGSNPIYGWFVSEGNDVEQACGLADLSDLDVAKTTSAYRLAEDNDPPSEGRMRFMLAEGLDFAEANREVLVEINACS